LHDSAVDPAARDNLRPYASNPVEAYSLRLNRAAAAVLTIIKAALQAPLQFNHSRTMGRRLVRQLLPSPGVARVNRSATLFEQRPADLDAGSAR
jgi:hypothetical protein